MVVVEELVEQVILRAGSVTSILSDRAGVVAPSEVDESTWTSWYSPPAPMTTQPSVGPLLGLRPSANFRSAMRLSKSAWE